MSPVAPGKLRLGGMALRNGLLVHGPTHWAAAVRAANGSVKVASGPKPTLGSRLDRIPGVRGVAKLGEAMAVIPLVKRALPEAKLPMQDVRTLAAMGAVSVTAAAIRRAGPRSAGREGAVALLSVVPAMLALRQGDLASWHGVEHKAIGAYEQGGAVADSSKEHDRCGSHLVAPLLSSSVAGTVAARRAGLRGPLADSAVALGSMAVAVEIFGWSERHAETALARALRRPGHEIQRVIGTREPSDEQIEVGRLAMEEILRVETAG
jgi:uncharacterized protein YqhQ